MLNPLTDTHVRLNDVNENWQMAPGLLPVVDRTLSTATVASELRARVEWNSLEAKVVVVNLSIQLPSAALNTFRSI